MPLPRFLIPLFLVAAVGCNSTRSYQPPTPAEMIGQARGEIDHERRLRQSIVLVAPKEQAVLQALRADERVTQAFFASNNSYISMGFLSGIDESIAGSFWFSVVIETSTDLPTDQAQAVITQALAKAGLTTRQPRIELVNDGRFWASARPFEASLAPLAQPQPMTTASFEHLIQP